MKCTLQLILILLGAMFLPSGKVHAQEADTLLLHYAVSRGDTVIYKRIVRYSKVRKLYHVRDYYENGQLQMDATYSSIDRKIKESWQCNYRTNTKQGRYKEWYENGRMSFSGRFKEGLATGRCKSWYPDGRIEADEGRLEGRLHGRVRYWSAEGTPEHDLRFSHGNNLNTSKVSYPYLPYLPKEYDVDSLKRWPLIIFLHGGTQRGTNLKKLYDAGIPDQIYRGREFPFIIISPLCPLHLRWSTDDWFENCYQEITEKYRIDTTRIYLTGMSLGGSGTWYLAAKYPEKFAAIAPMSGFIFSSESDLIIQNIDQLAAIPVWAFHGRIDTTVPFEETERMVKLLDGRNNELRFTVEPEVGHWIHWIYYPGSELYEWFLKFTKK